MVLFPPAHPLSFPVAQPINTTTTNVNSRFSAFTQVQTQTGIPSSYSFLSLSVSVSIFYMEMMGGIHAHDTRARTRNMYVQETLQTRRKRKHGYVEIHFSPKPTSIQDKPRYRGQILYVCIQGTVQYTFEYIHILEIKREERRKGEVKE